LARKALLLGRRVPLARLVRLAPRAGLAKGQLSQWWLRLARVAQTLGQAATGYLLLSGRHRQVSTPSLVMHRAVGRPPVRR
jgi:hypothetical protein